MKKLFDDIFNQAKVILIKNEELIDKTSHSLVVSVVMGQSGKLYYGMNVGWWHSVCAEPVAVSNAFQAGERKLEYLMAVMLNKRTKKLQVVSPCGICREMFNDLNMRDLKIILKEEDNYIIKTINDMLP